MMGNSSTDEWEIIFSHSIEKISQFMSSKFALAKSKEEKSVVTSHESEVTDIFLSKKGKKFVYVLTNL